MNKYIKPPSIARLITKNSVVWDFPTQKKKLYLTFDDGPIPELTPLILKILKKYNVKATFFCVGDNIKKYPDTFDLLLQDNHDIGNHTYNHLNGWRISGPAYVKNVKKFDKQFYTPLLRPPYGKIKPTQIYKLATSHRIIQWSVLTYDFDQTLSGDDCLQIAINNIYNGAIVVFHDNIKATERVLYALPLFIEYCLAKGYTFHLISEEIKYPFRHRSKLGKIISQFDVED